MKTYEVYYIDVKDDCLKHTQMTAERIEDVCARMYVKGHEIIRIEEVQPTGK